MPRQATTKLPSCVDEFECARWRPRTASIGLGKTEMSSCGTQIAPGRSRIISALQRMVLVNGFTQFLRLTLAELTGSMGVGWGHQRACDSLIGSLENFQIVHLSHCKDPVVVTKFAISRHTQVLRRPFHPLKRVCPGFTSLFGCMILLVFCPAPLAY